MTTKKVTKGVSFQTPVILLKEIDIIAKHEHRTRTGQILYFLEKNVSEFKKRNKRIRVN